MFDRSLNDLTKRRYPFRPVSVALIDCDLYSSTADVLTWLGDVTDEAGIKAWIERCDAHRPLNLVIANSL